MSGAGRGHSHPQYAVRLLRSGPESKREQPGGLPAVALSEIEGAKAGQTVALPGSDDPELA